jgi:hypothetical protein
VPVPIDTVATAWGGGTLTPPFIYKRLAGRHFRNRAEHGDARRPFRRSDCLIPWYSKGGTFGAGARDLQATRVASSALAGAFWTSNRPAPNFRESSGLSAPWCVRYEAARKQKGLALDALGDGCRVRFDRSGEHRPVRSQRRTRLGDFPVMASDRSDLCRETVRTFAVRLASK